MPEKPGPDSFPEALRKVAPYLHLGTTFAATVGLAILAGWWLDTKLGTSPWLLLGGIVLGIASAFFHFFRVVFPKRREEAAPGESGEMGGKGKTGKK